MTEQGKTIAIIAHITIIGWIIAIIMNNSEKSEYASFYIRQLLGLFLVGIVGSLIPIVQFVAGILVLILVILSLISAINGEKQLTPVVGQYFQDWFKGI